MEAFDGPGTLRDALEFTWAPSGPVSGWQLPVECSCLSIKGKMVASRGSKELPTPKKQRMGGREGTTKRSVKPGLDERVPVVADDGAVEGRDASPPRAPSVGASNDTGDERPKRQDAAVVGGEEPDHARKPAPIVLGVGTHFSYSLPPSRATQTQLPHFVN